MGLIPTEHFGMEIDKGGGSLGGLLQAFDPGREEPFCFLKLRTPTRAEAAAGSVDEVRQHPHSGAGTFRRHALAGKRAGDGRGILRKQILGRMRRICFHLGDPAVLLVALTFCAWHRVSLASMMFEVLHRAFMRLRGFSG